MMIIRFPASLKQFYLNAELGEYDVTISFRDFCYFFQFCGFTSRSNFHDDFVLEHKVLKGSLSYYL